MSDTPKLSRDGRPKIFEYDNYRLFLNDFYTFSKEQNPNFSFRYFARLAGFQAGNVLKLVMDGKRNISAASIDKFAKGLKLNKEETDFFQNLVQLNQAKTIDEKKTFALEITRSRKFRQMYPMKESQFHFYLTWFLTPLRELVCLPDFREDPDWMASKLIPNITFEEARRGVEELLKLGLLKRDVDGRLLQTEPHITTMDEVVSSSIGHFHREMMAMAAQSIDTVKREDRDISAQTFAVSEKTAKKIKEMIQLFRKEIVDVVSQDETPDAVYQLNFQLFPFALAKKGGAKR